jgi:adenosine deaminase
MVRVARNSYSASFIPDAEKKRYLDDVDAYAATAVKS